jgi:hypothetical protein
MSIGSNFMLNPYSILACFALFVLSTAGAYVAGRRDGQRIELASCLATAAAIDKASDKASDAAAKAIAEQKPVTQVIKQRVETITREVPVYRDCLSDPAVERLLDDARAGRPVSAGGGVVPGSEPGPAP